MSRRARGYMTVDVDLTEALSECSDEMIREEFEERKLKLGQADFDPVEELKTIREELLRGRPAEALAILNALLSPKWSTARACEIALAAVRKSPATALTSG